MSAKQLLIVSLFSLAACGTGSVQPGGLGSADGGNGAGLAGVNGAAASSSGAGAAVVWKFTFGHVSAFADGHIEIETQAKSNGTPRCADWSKDHLEFSVENASYPVDAGARLCASSSTATLVFHGLPKQTGLANTSLTFYPSDGPEITYTMLPW